MHCLPCFPYQGKPAHHAAAQKKKPREQRINVNHSLFYPSIVHSRNARNRKYRRALQVLKQQQIAAAKTSCSQNSRRSMPPNRRRITSRYDVCFLPLPPSRNATKRKTVKVWTCALWTSRSQPTSCLRTLMPEKSEKRKKKARKAAARSQRDEQRSTFTLACTAHSRCSSRAVGQRILDGAHGRSHRSESDRIRPSDQSTAHTPAIYVSRFRPTLHLCSQSFPALTLLKTTHPRFFFLLERFAGLSILS